MGTKAGVKRFLRLLGLEVHRVAPPATTDTAAPGGYSYCDEDERIAELLRMLGDRVEERVLVDIGAGNGRSMSNTLRLYEQGWSGLSIEYDPHLFSKLAERFAARDDVLLFRQRVTPENAPALLEAAEIPEAFGFLGLDIDGYDHFVLASILERYRPRLVCTEVNIKIPPPVKFAVRYDPDFAWAGDHFYGQSIARLQVLAEACGYALVELHYNNAFLVPAEIAPLPSLSAEDAYARGYRDRPDRLERFPWNVELEPWLQLGPDELLDAVERQYAPYRGRFELSL